MIAALIPCSGLRRHNEDWIQAIRTLLSIPHSNDQQPYLNKTASALVWLRPLEAKQQPGAWTPICIPAQLFPEFEEESTCAA